MSKVGTYVTGAAGLLLLSGTLAAGPESALAGRDMAATVADKRELPARHPPVEGWHSPGSVQPRLPEGHPPLPDLAVCPVTGAIGKQPTPRKPGKAIEELVRI
ncbi:MAG: hypothetical protein AMJ58_03140 [Gammaproteobacteria bacterium SG8_30]|nr:MAG: hypothetical protein AMJ58_03140 [Gammaproteobacteria bacterium SG8_30]